MNAAVLRALGKPPRFEEFRDPKPSQGTSDQLINLADGTGTATYTLTAANGDTVVVAISAHNTNIPGGVMFQGDYMLREVPAGLTERQGAAF